MLLIIDNYDSFTHNLAQYFQCLGQEVLIYAHDTITINMIEQLDPKYLVISPGPKGPRESGVSLTAIKHFYQKIPILGVCLGHQCIGYTFGATVIRAPEVIHGKTSCIYHNQQGLFAGLPTPFLGTRYHSLAIDRATLPSDFTVDAWTEDTVMAISHQNYPLYGLQFHPEAILTEHGMALLSNFLQYAT